MRNCIKKLFLLLIFLFILPVLALAAEYKVNLVYDGDTIEVGRSGYTITVDLLGIEAPNESSDKMQSGQVYDQKAKEYLEELILDETVSIVGYNLDVNNQLLGEVFFEGRSVNILMLKAGLAHVNLDKTPKGFHLEAYWEAEKEARRARKGIWRQNLLQGVFNFQRTQTSPNNNLRQRLP